MIKKVIYYVKKRARRYLIEKNPYYLSYFNYCDKFWHRFPFNLEVVNLGSNSALFGFRYDGLPIKAANWALSPQSLNQDLAILKTYYSFIGPRGTIIVPLGPYSSCLKSYTDTEWLRYFTIIHPGVNERFSEEKQEAAYMLKDHPFRVSRKQMIHGILQYIKKVICLRKNPLEYAKCPLSDNEIEENALSFINGWKKQFDIDDMDAEIPKHISQGRKIRIETLKEIIKFCNERRLRIFVVLPPVTRALSKHFSSAFKENYIYSFLRDAGLPNDSFMDYLDDIRFQKNELFYNSLFLNKTGGRLFTEQVLKDLDIL